MSLKRHAFRNNLVELLEDMKGSFAPKRTDPGGNPARFITLRNVEIVEFNALDDKTEVLAEIDFQSNNGDWKQEILIRQFATSDMLKEELDLYAKIEERCQHFDVIEPVKIINVDERKFRVIYDLEEAIGFEVFRESNEIAHNLIGKVLAILQGGDKYGLNQTSLRELCQFIIQQIPIPESDKEMVGMLLEPHFPIIDFSPGGYNPCTLFDTSLIRIVITRMGSYLVYIIPHQTIEPISDRMTDVAAIYAEVSYDEYCAYGTVDRTKNQIELFFQGYNELSGLVHGTPLEKLYPHGITLDLQMFINFFLLEMKKFSDGIAFRNPISIQYVNFLLTKKPFLFI